MNTEEKEVFVAQMEKHLRQTEKDVKYLREINKRLKSIQKNADILNDYYFSQEWLNDYENLKTVGVYDVLNQDSAYNALQDLHVEKMKLLKYIAKYI